MYMDDEVLGKWRIERVAIIGIFLLIALCIWNVSGDDLRVRHSGSSLLSVLQVYWTGHTDTLGTKDRLEWHFLRSIGRGLLCSIFAYRPFCGHGRLSDR